MNFESLLKNLKSAKDYIAGVMDAKKHSSSMYTISFTREANGKWYVDLPKWKGSHDSLQMVAGADDMLELIGNGAPHVKLQVIKHNTKLDGLDVDMICDRVNYSMAGGATYHVFDKEGDVNKMWLCPVTLFVLGEYPKHLYIKKVA